jgi:GNAT superfamily N-acetyltransferase
MTAPPADQASYSYEPLVSAAGSTFEGFYGIYAHSIALREQKPRARIADMVARPDYRILLVKKNDVVAGFSMIFAPAAETFCLLEYMAIAEPFRNAGLGAQLFVRSAGNVAISRGAVPMLLEVDSDRQPSGDLTVIRRRQQFYRRLGCLRVDGLSYLLPLSGEGPPPAMDLLVHFAGKPFAVRKSQLASWLTAIYTSVYGCPPDDPRLPGMTATLADPVPLAET